MENISFIGAGNMANSIICGLLANGYPPKYIYAANRNVKKLTILQQQYAINITTDNIAATQQADILILAVKPQQLDIICQQLQPIITNKRPLILSIVTGKTLATLEKKLAGSELAIVRCMPNTPAAIGYGITAAFANTFVSKIQKEKIITILNAIGTQIWLNHENQLNIVTAVTAKLKCPF